MSAGTQIDYGALARQAGAISSQPAGSPSGGNVDYANLAKQSGSIDYQPPASVPEGHWLSATEDQLADYAHGIGQGALQTVTSVSRLLNKIPGVGETLAPSQGVNAMRIAATPRTTAQKLGAGTEQLGELLIPGDAEASLAAKVGFGTLQGAGSVLAHEAGTTQDVSGRDVAIGGATGAAAPLLSAGMKAALSSKIARGAINESMMATARDVAYGNPAKALLDEEITSPFTGDLEKFKSAIRSGATLQGAAQAAGGRIADINSAINTIKPELQAVLAPSTTRIPSNVVTDAIDNGIASIKANRGITAADSQSAIAELQAIRQAALKIPTVPGATATAWAPLEANALKQEIGASIDWGGRERVGQLVDPVRKQVYGSLKNAVNSAVPEAADLNERLTNLYAAQEDINKLAGYEEVGRGRSLGGVIGPSWMGRAEALAGRFIPGAAWLTPKASSTARSIVIPAVTQARPDDNSGSQVIHLSDLLGGQQ